MQRILVLLAAMLLLAGCAQDVQPPATTAAPTAEPTTAPTAALRPEWFTARIMARSKSPSQARQA